MKLSENILQQFLSEFNSNLIAMSNITQKYLGIINNELDTKESSRKLVYKHDKPFTVNQTLLNRKFLTMPRAFEKYLGITLNGKISCDIFWGDYKIYGTISYIARHYKSSDKPYLLLTVPFIPQNLKIGDQYDILFFKNNDMLELHFEKI